MQSYILIGGTELASRKCVCSLCESVGVCVNA